MKYDFDVVMDAFVPVKGRKKTKKVIASGFGISRVTLNRWIKKARNDRESLEKRYGTIYYDMFVPGVIEAYITHVGDDRYSMFRRIASLITDNETIFFMKSHHAEKLLTQDWYKDLFEAVSDEEKS